MEILRRDNYTCRYCGGTAPDVKLTIDHVTPVTLGGNDAPDNLVAACADCNAGKASVSPDSGVVDDVAQDALRWAAAMKEAAGIAQGERYAEYDRHDLFHKAWSDWLPGFNGAVKWLPDDWPDTLNQFHAAGLDIDEVRDSVYITSRKQGLYDHDFWRYFCGVCWRKIDKLNAIARGLLAADETP